MNRPRALTRTLLASVVATGLLAGCAQQEDTAATALDTLQERASTIRQLASEQNLSTALDEVDLLENDLDKAAANGHIATEMQQEAANALTEVREELEVLAKKAAQPDDAQTPEPPAPEETFSDNGEENDDGRDSWDDEDQDRWEDQQDESWDQWEDEQDDSDDGHHH